MEGMSSSSDEGGNDFKINKEYAKNYKIWRRKEELQKAKSRGLVLSESSSDSESDEGIKWSAKVDQTYWKVLGALYAKRPLPPGANVIDDDSSEEEKKSAEKKKRKKREKPMFLSDYDRKMVQKGGFKDDSDSDEEEDEPLALQEKNLKKTVLAAIHSSDSDTDSDLLVEKQKTAKEKRKEEADYRAFLQGKIDDLPNKELAQELKPVRDVINDPNLDPNMKSVFEYLLTTDPSKEDSDCYDDDDVVPLEEDEDFLEKQEEQIRKYNFRYEEEGGDEVKTFPREIPESVRNKDTRRKEHREKVKERKKQEKEAKMEEMQQLANMKRKEIEAKIEKLKEAIGNPSLGITEDDLEGDFDPAAHDAMMSKYCGENYEAMDPDEEKPTWEDEGDDEFGQDPDWDSWQPEASASWADQAVQRQASQDAGDPNFNMDCDYDPAQDEGMSKKKRKKMSKLAKALRKKKPVFNPDEKNYEEYYNDYYNLHCEDIVGGMPFRFKYRSVVSNDFGLSNDEIFYCPDRELNRWASLWKIKQRRSEDAERKDVHHFKRKGSNLQKKLKVIPSLLSKSEEEKSVEQEDTGAARSQATKRRKKGKKQSESAETFQSQEENSISEDDPPSKRKKVQEAEPSTSHTSAMTHDQTEQKKPKKKRKKKKNRKETHDGMSENRQGNFKEKAPRTGVEAPRTGVEAPRTGVEAPRTGVEAPRTGVEAPRTGVEAPRTGVERKASEGDGNVKSKEKKKSKQKVWKQISQISAERLKAYGIKQPKKLMYRDLKVSRRKDKSALD